MAENKAGSGGIGGRSDGDKGVGRGGEGLGKEEVVDGWTMR